MNYFPEYKYRPGACPVAEPKQWEGYGGDEIHSCPCGGSVKVCRNCGGDYHEKPEEKEKCYLKK